MTFSRFFCCHHWYAELAIVADKSLMNLFTSQVSFFVDMRIFNFVHSVVCAIFLDHIALRFCLRYIFCFLSVFLMFLALRNVRAIEVRHEKRIYLC